MVHSVQPPLPVNDILAERSILPHLLTQLHQITPQPPPLLLRSAKYEHHSQPQHRTFDLEVRELKLELQPMRIGVNPHWNVIHGSITRYRNIRSGDSVICGDGVEGVVEETADDALGAEFEEVVGVGEVAEGGVDEHRICWRCDDRDSGLPRIKDGDGVAALLAYERCKRLD
ncbi:hypothetical protein LTS10_006352 [Elasticomyces elasticus]|nr:hypothetical protein LTS10_006352 [Elasticomyces elasticus]